ncbi:chaperonin 10-like protein [Plectosphaerella cucumerina]|uniref:Chaperonin 10-like protein n=1 Tax=Plectosphaerella cucumerina TaxID=40658 RepID=A0A8K0TFJ6_9PEZI|nr:chaperonin 10-like protein [Plectosphaerella cucumerina]
MDSIRAIVNISPGKAEIRNVPRPELPVDRVLVRPTAWAINPDDVYRLGLDGEESSAGTIVGLDYAGVVVEVGSDVTKEFMTGDRIAGFVPGQNLFVVKGDAQIKVPENLSDTDAATQGVAISTIGLALYRHLKLPLPGEHRNKPFTVFINGGSTAMGTEAVQFVKLSGGNLITTASPANKEYIRSYGADHVLDYKSPSLEQDVRTLAGGDLEYIFDTWPDDASARLSAKLLSRDGGARYVALIPGAEKPVKALNPAVEAMSMLAHSTQGEPYVYEGQYFGVVPSDYAHHREFVVLAEKLFAEGKIRAPRIFLNRGGNGLEGILHGLKELESGDVRGGKLVYTV